MKKNIFFHEKNSIPTLFRQYPTCRTLFLNILQELSVIKLKCFICQPQNLSFAQAGMEM